MTQKKKKKILMHIVQLVLVCLIALIKNVVWMLDKYSNSTDIKH